MSAPDLMHQFRRCLRYQQAASWQKPWIDPARFLRNQSRKLGLIPTVPGRLRTVTAFHLPEFTVVDGEGVSQEIASYGFFEPELTEAFLNLVKPGQVVVDIGMHLGYYTTLFALLVGEQGQVHSFEPTPSTREISKKNTTEFSQVRVSPFAVWSSVQTFRFRDYGPQWMAFNSLGKSKKLSSEPAIPDEIDVQTITLDHYRQFLDQPVSLVKIDAESAEREILAGAKAFLELDRPLVTVEVGDQDDSGESRRLVEDLLAMNYMPWEFRFGEFHRHVVRDSYAYDNLVFAPKERDLSSV